MKNRNAMIVYLCSVAVAIGLLLVFRQHLVDDYKFLIIGISSLLILAPLGLLRGSEPEDEYQRLERRKQSLLVFCMFVLTSILLLVVGIVPFTAEVTTKLFVGAFIACVIAVSFLASALFLAHNRK